MDNFKIFVSVILFLSGISLIAHKVIQERHEAQMRPQCEDRGGVAIKAYAGKIECFHPDAVLNLEKDKETNND